MKEAEKEGRLNIKKGNVWLMEKRDLTRTNAIWHKKKKQLSPGKRVCKGGGGGKKGDWHRAGETRLRKDGKIGRPVGGGKHRTRRKKKEKNEGHSKVKGRCREGAKSEDRSYQGKRREVVREERGKAASRRTFETWSIEQEGLKTDD